MSKRKTALMRSLSAAALVSATTLPALGQLNELFSEDFEKFQLFPNIEEGIETGNPQMVDEAFFGDAVSAVPFNGTWAQRGWTMQIAEPDMIGVGTAEWIGWSVANKEFWVNAAFQNREQFTKGQGSVLVADPDEWDDFDPNGLDPDATANYNTNVVSPAISLQNVIEDTAEIRFDSSWWDEDEQVARLEVSFDGGPWILLLEWTSDPNDPRGTVDPGGQGNNFGFKPAAFNETVVLSVDNPGAANEMRVRFNMPSAENDWWWAVDNIAVSGEGGEPTEPPTAFDLFVDTFNPTTTPTIEWKVSLNAVDYEVVIADDADFNDVVVSAVTTNLFFTPDPGDLLAGSYYVKVVARNDLGTEEATGRFGVDNPDPADLDANTRRDIFDLVKFEGLFSN